MAALLAATFATGCPPPTAAVPYPVEIPDDTRAATSDEVATIVSRGAHEVDVEALTADLAQRLLLVDEGLRGGAVVRLSDAGLSLSPFAVDGVGPWSDAGEVTLGMPVFDDPGGRASLRGLTSGSLRVGPNGTLSLGVRVGAEGAVGPFRKERWTWPIDALEGPPRTRAAALGWAEAAGYLVDFRADCVDVTAIDRHEGGFGACASRWRFLPGAVADASRPLVWVGGHAGAAEVAEAYRVDLNAGVDGEQAPYARFAGALAVWPVSAPASLGPKRNVDAERWWIVDRQASSVVASTPARGPMTPRERFGLPGRVLSAGLLADAIVVTYRAGRGHTVFELRRRADGHVLTAGEVEGTIWTIGVHGEDVLWVRRGTDGTLQLGRTRWSAGAVGQTLLASTGGDAPARQIDAQCAQWWPVADPSRESTGAEVLARADASASSPVVLSLTSSDEQPSALESALCGLGLSVVRVPSVLARPHGDVRALLPVGPPAEGAAAQAALATWRRSMGREGPPADPTAVLVVAALAEGERVAASIQTATQGARAPTLWISAGPSASASATQAPPGPPDLRAACTALQVSVPGRHAVVGMHAVARVPPPTAGAEGPCVLTPLVGVVASRRGGDVGVARDGDPAATTGVQRSQTRVLWSAQVLRLAVDMVDAIDRVKGDAPIRRLERAP